MNVGTREKRLRLSSVDITGKKFGKLTALRFSHHSGNSSPGSAVQKWWFLCECGIEKVITKSAVVSGITKSCGCLSKKHFINLVGNEFNGNEVVRLLGQNNHNCWLYEFRCKCGMTFTGEGNDIKSGKIKSCGCRWNSDWVKNANPIESQKKTIMAGYKASAKKRGLKFEVTPEEFRSFIEGNCYFCGVPPNRVRKVKNDTFKYNGLDRLDNLVGYVKGNVVSACAECNQAKHLMTEEYFKVWMQRCFAHMNQGQGFWGEK